MLSHLEAIQGIALKILPLYAFVLIGLVAGRLLEIQPKTIATLLLYIFAPLVFFQMTLEADIVPKDLALTGLYFGVSSLIAVATFALLAKWARPERNILAYGAGSSNAAFFALPASIALLGPAAAGPALLFMLGFSLYDATTGFFLTARGHHSPREALIRTLKLPHMYAFFLALALKSAGFGHLPPAVAAFTSQLRACYFVLGMSLLGMVVGQMRFVSVDKAFVLTTQSIKFVVWPATIFALTALDQATLRFLDPLAAQVLRLTSLAPLANSGIVLSTELKAAPEKMAMAIMISVFLSLLTIPIYCTFFL